MLNEWYRRAIESQIADRTTRSTRGRQSTMTARDTDKRRRFDNQTKPAHGEFEDYLFEIQQEIKESEWHSFWQEHQTIRRLQAYRWKHRRPVGKRGLFKITAELVDASYRALALFSRRLWRPGIYFHHGEEAGYEAF
jgi:hypothetical protein